MTKKEILKKINYNGKYTKEVKSNLKKMIVKYHPDHNNGDDSVFKLLNSIKKDLDSGKKISFEEEIVEKKEPVIKDKSEYLEKIRVLKLERDSVKAELDSLYKESDNIKIYYHDIHNQNRKNNYKLYDIRDSIDELKKFKKRYIFMLIILLIFILIFVNTMNIVYLIIFVVLMLLVLLYAFITIKKVSKVSDYLNNKLKVSNSLLNDMKKYNDDNEKIKKDIIELERKINKINNEIRLYENLMEK